MQRSHCFFFFFFNDTATTEIYTLSLHDALPIFFTAEALEFIADLHRRFNPTRLDLLRRRGKRQARGGQGKALDFSKATRRVRGDSWAIAPVPGDLTDRRGWGDGGRPPPEEE